MATKMGSGAAYEFRRFVDCEVSFLRLRQSRLQLLEQHFMLLPKALQDPLDKGIFVRHRGHSAVVVGRHATRELAFMAQEEIGESKEFLRITARTLDCYRDQGLTQAVKATGKVLFTQDDIEAFLKKSKEN
jgi:hypothetical protein